MALAAPAQALLLRGLRPELSSRLLSMFAGLAPRVAGAWQSWLPSRTWLAAEQTGKQACVGAGAVGQAANGQPTAAELFGYCLDFLRPRKFSVRLDVKMKRGAAPYPRDTNRRKGVPRIKGILRKLID
eukprot:TRINITY_DN34367_c0_g1_i1.p2 TRINITY_DN34367_c0_g1~~TRINITY_DN34367_c0_g1_i1.p2  ORF type:complete len:128 (-),score=29.91 TRINITY_DN34367_c0_g1_i1:109-492(-)